MTNFDAAEFPAISMSVSTAGRGEATLVLGGRLDMVEAVTVRERLSQDDLVSAQYLVIDLAAVTFVDSAGLAVLARARRDRVLEGGTVTLVRPRSDDAMRVFRLTQFDQIFVMLDPTERGST